MSASLVGSEMCIRDSASGAATQRSELRPVGGRACGSATAACVEQHTHAPVSYTHLTLRRYA
eukprot:1534102-Alexandrium_andersonii.AAC.1